MRIIYMGTPDFAVPVLESLLDSRHEVVAVVTQPDKPKGRGKAMQFPPVKEKALEHNLPVYQPEKVKDEAFLQILEEYAPDCIVVTAFGQILPKSILELPKYGCVNVHASLLPAYRGAAPIQWAIINGEEKTGITTMQLGTGPVDSGDMLLKAEVTITPEETGESLFNKLAVTGGPLLLETLEGLEAGTIVPEKQDESFVSHASMLKKETGSIDWNKSSIEIERLIRGLNPWPSAYTKLSGKTLKIWRAEVLPDNTPCQPGQIISTEGGKLLIQTGDGQLSLLEVQLEGKKRMPADAFLRGYAVEAGTIL